jgi:hypothetical protein
VVLPEELCERLTAAALAESRTVSNMAKVLIQRGLDSLAAASSHEPPQPPLRSDGLRGRDRRVDAVPEYGPDLPTDRFREVLERQERTQPRRLRGLPRRLRLPRSST